MRLGGANQFRVIRAGFREVGKIPSDRSDQAGVALHVLVVGHSGMRIVDSLGANEFRRVPHT